MSATTMTAGVAARPPSTLPRVVLRLDAFTAGPFGLLLLAGARPVGEFLGWDEPVALAGIGAFVVAYAALLWRAARQERIGRWHLLAPILLNGAWVTGSALVLLVGTPDLSTGGRWAVAVVADLVAVVALAQFVALRRLA